MLPSYKRSTQSVSSLPMHAGGKAYRYPVPMQRTSSSTISTFSSVSAIMVVSVSTAEQLHETPAGIRQRDLAVGCVHHVPLHWCAQSPRATVAMGVLMTKLACAMHTVLIGTHSTHLASR